VDDGTIVRAILDGDESAFGDVVAHYSSDVFRTCYRVLGRVDEAEEAAQETFVSAYRSLATFRAEGNLGGWLAAIAVRQSLRLVATRRRFASVRAPIEAADAVFTSGDDPLDLVLRDERHDEARRALAEIGEPYREVLALRFFADQSLESIAASTGRPLGTVKAQLHRGLERLRRNSEGRR
jgi:RNA polymerase sigma-70 factor, ECF subfamily